MSKVLRVLLTVYSALGLLVFLAATLTDGGYARAIDWYLFNTPIMMMGGALAYCLEDF